MTDREKLIKLLNEAHDEYYKHFDMSRGYMAVLADHLLANGVTFAKDTDVPSKWISVEERLPESEKIVLASAKSKTFGYHHVLMVAHIGYHEFSTDEHGWRDYEGDTEYDEENDCFWVPECWYEVNSVEDNGNWIIDSDYVVTHWMPLPEPPKEVNYGKE